MSDEREKIGYIRFVGEDEKKRDIHEEKSGSGSGRFFLKLFLASMAIGAAVYIFLIVFHVKQVDITGTNYCTKDDILKWLDSENGRFNSLYTLLRQNHGKPDYPPAVKSIHVSMQSPRHISLKVQEKQIAGYIDYHDSYLCFDLDGTAMLILPRGTYIEGAAYVQGIQADDSKVNLGDTLSVSDDKIFKKIVQASRLFEKYALAPESITYEESGLKVCFPFVEVLLGKSGYERRIAQIPPILERLAEKYPAVEGTLHLEKFDADDRSVRFVPKGADKAE